MPFAVGCLALVAPRVTLLLVWLLGELLQTVYGGCFWPVLGFVFLPVTTLAYAWSIDSNGTIEGWYFVLTTIAVLIDLGLFKGGTQPIDRDDDA